MRQVISVSSLRKLLSFQGDEWTRGPYMSIWCGLLPEDAAVVHYNLGRAHVFMLEGDESGHAFCTYQKKDWISEFHPEEEKVYFWLPEFLTADAWNVKENLELTRSAMTSRSAVSLQLSRQDPAGWEQLLHEMSPYLQTPMFLSSCRRAIEKGTYLVSRNVAGKIEYLVLYLRRATQYWGLYMWAKPESCARYVRDLVNLHKVLEEEGVVQFKALCLKENEPSMHLHKLLGYEVTGRYWIYYR